MSRVLPDEIGFYFAGLVDGEGCFSISKDRCDFILKMRADDQALLFWLRHELGDIGLISYETKGGGTSTRRPQARWSISRKKDLVFLTKLFDAYPLRSKKARDYAIWREAVIAWSAGMAPAGLVAYKDQLKAARAYGAHPLLADRLAERAGSKRKGSKAS